MLFFHPRGPRGPNIFFDFFIFKHSPGVPGGPRGSQGAQGVKNTMKTWCEGSGAPERKLTLEWIKGTSLRFAALSKVRGVKSRAMSFPCKPKPLTPCLHREVSTFRASNSIRPDKVSWISWSTLWRLDLSTSIHYKMLQSWVLHRFQGRYDSQGFLVRVVHLLWFLVPRLTCLEFHRELATTAVPRGPNIFWISFPFFNTPGAPPGVPRSPPGVPGVIFIHPRDPWGGLHTPQGSMGCWIYLYIYAYIV